MAKQSKLVVGRSESINIPEWGIEGLLAKVDTGARTSALHVEDLVRLPDGHVLFHVIVSQKPHVKRIEVRAKAIKWGKVRSSSGHYTIRCFVSARAQIGPLEKEIEISLDSREKMAYRMLLGRKALEKDFLVDVSGRHRLTGPEKSAKKRKSG